MPDTLNRDANEPDREAQLQLSAQAVEELLARIGVDVDAARMAVESGYGWNFLRGSALIEIYLTPEDWGYLQVLSPIMHLPQSNLLALYRRLLELNLELTQRGAGRARRCGLSVSRTAAGGAGRGRGGCDRAAAGAGGG